ncbi:MAG: sigma-70 family RNA polymerase sigma factor [Xanthomonadales bacterium]|nr:sigma-70 family RNA polymerase sigma factor [Xanthomonadales bacterium]
METTDLATDLAAIAERIGNGDRDAESALFERYYRAACAVARRHCRPNEPQVEDIVQNVMMDLLQRLRDRRISDPRALPHYLQLSIRNACTAWYRTQSRWQAGTEIDTEPLAAEDPPDEVQARRIRNACVRELVSELPVARDRELLRRFYLLEESREEVCLTLEIEESNFRKIINRARMRLREVIKNRGPRELQMPR